MEKQNEKKQSCHESNKEGHKGGLKHGLMMILCCMLPILVIAALPLLGLGGGRLSSFAFLLCPLMHIGMMFMMRKSGHGGSCHGSKEDDYKAERE
ncbi:hypothetical protein [Geosporobacter ferrireducens]|uniref:DUF2933 domain-containing protein n=1 Tax=Geosporobacter ferrireducens TaxID=1424294 RepID=A0A1D8GE52_9FIRM|nr:hypothetical protein [Geosporobacter ferrireducens]AOT69187.1 hypothetical protein Gferi_06180 [Geosporobacter ferrireducens]MTI56864.1 DUF2933 domain-containing protein [Geosporobacter ferrireducens]